MITRLSKTFPGERFSGKTYLILNEAISHYDFFRVNIQVSSPKIRFVSQLSEENVSETLKCTETTIPQ